MKYLRQYCSRRCNSIKGGKSIDKLRELKYLWLGEKVCREFNMSSAINESLCLNAMADKAFLNVKFNAIQYYSR